MTTLNVYVLQPRSKIAGSLIDRGSAIVAMPPPASAERVHAYFESNRYGAENMRSFEDKVFHAASRLVTKYPTVAQASIPLTELIEVGTFEYEDRRLTISNPEALMFWQEGQ